MKKKMNRKSGVLFAKQRQRGASVHASVSFIERKSGAFETIALRQGNRPSRRFALLFASNKQFLFLLGPIEQTRVEYPNFTPDYPNIISK